MTKKILVDDRYEPVDIHTFNENIGPPLDSTSGTFVSRKNGRYPEVAIWVYGDKQNDIQETFQEISRFIQSKIFKQDIMIRQKLLPNITTKEVRQFQIA